MNIPEKHPCPVCGKPAFRVSADFYLCTTLPNPCFLVLGKPKEATKALEAKS